MKGGAGLGSSSGRDLEGGAVARYSTGLGVTGGSALIHEFCSSEVPNPTHLKVDTGFRVGEVTIKACVSVNLSLGDGTLAAKKFLLIFA
ncbi:Eukaryotic translation initiation factor 3 subunit F [Turnera subulata]|uniref:Eukaryotic translation initiation factor 3 subunit F n=2 Tax=Turnera subulata TaxID=218843 RepID=A0A9Q0EZG3_9ROSI|nr:Eukaryotic translation initiation factor 3 subunit F [Turnera subulata]KAJ4828731.1 Eukaryotic translation initiation factor 3 subunit F [Turnera subulata]